MTEQDRKRLTELEARVIDLQLGALRKDLDDHEKRLRPLEETATRFNFLLYLTVGGGLLSLLNLVVLIASIVIARNP